MIPLSPTQLQTGFADIYFFILLQILFYHPSCYRSSINIKYFAILLLIFLNFPTDSPVPVAIPAISPKIEYSLLRKQWSWLPWSQEGAILKG